MHLWDIRKLFLIACSWPLDKFAPDDLTYVIRSALTFEVRHIAGRRQFQFRYLGGLPEDCPFTHSNGWQPKTCRQTEGTLQGQGFTGFLNTLCPETYLTVRLLGNGPADVDPQDGSVKSFLSCRFPCQFCHVRLMHRERWIESQKGRETLYRVTYIPAPSNFIEPTTR